MRGILKNILCVIFAVVAAYLFSSWIGSLYCSIVGGCSAGIASINFAPVVGLMLGYFFFIPLVFLFFDAKAKYWWTSLLTIPILLWALYIEIRLTQVIPFVLSAAAGLFVGTLAHKTLQKLAPAFMANIS